MKLPQVVTLAPLTRQKIDISVNMPKETFNGIIAGGISFSEENQTGSTGKDQGISVKNTYSYTLALLMQQNQTLVSPNLKMNTLQAGQVNGRNVINVNLQNTSMGYLNTMNVEAEVTGVTNKNLKYNFSNPMMQMAPNTNFDLPIPVSIQDAATRISEPIQAGKYHLHMIVNGRTDVNGQYTALVNGKTEHYKYQWVFDKEFTISGEQAKKLNATDPTVKKDITWIYWLIGVGVLILLIIIFFIILWKRRKKDEEEKNEAEELRKKLRAQEEVIRELSRKNEE